MSDLSKSHGFWSAALSLRVKELLTIEILAGVALGLLIGITQIVSGTPGSRGEVVELFTTIVPALIGVVFAGFALLVAFLTPAYMTFLEDGPTGILGFFRPFLLAIGMQCVLVVSTIAYIAAEPILGSAVEKTLFVVLSVLFSSAVMDVIALARSVLMQSTLRAKFENYQRRQNPER